MQIRIFNFVFLYVSFSFILNSKINFHILANASQINICPPGVSHTSQTSDQLICRYDLNFNEDDKRSGAIFQTDCKYPHNYLAFKQKNSEYNGQMKISDEICKRVFSLKVESNGNLYSEVDKESFCEIRLREQYLRSTRSIIESECDLNILSRNSRPHLTLKIQRGTLCRKLEATMPFMSQQSIYTCRNQKYLRECNNLRCINNRKRLGRFPQCQLNNKYSNTNPICREKEFFIKPNKKKCSTDLFICLDNSSGSYDLRGFIDQMLNFLNDLYSEQFVNFATVRLRLTEADQDTIGYLDQNVRSNEERERNAFLENLLNLDGERIAKSGSSSVHNCVEYYLNQNQNSNSNKTLLILTRMLSEGRSSEEFMKTFSRLKSSGQNSVLIAKERDNKKPEHYKMFDYVKFENNYNVQSASAEEYVNAICQAVNLRKTTLSIKTTYTKNIKTTETTNNFLTETETLKSTTKNTQITKLKTIRNSIQSEHTNTKISKYLRTMKSKTKITKLKKSQNTFSKRKTLYGKTMRRYRTSKLNNTKIQMSVKKLNTTNANSKIPTYFKNKPIKNELKNQKRNSNTLLQWILIVAVILLFMIIILGAIYHYNHKKAIEEENASFKKDISVISFTDNEENNDIEIYEPELFINKMRGFGNSLD